MTLCRSVALAVAMYTMLVLGAGAASAEPREIVLAVANMSCPACPYIIERSLKELDGVREVDVSYEAKSARVIYEDSMVSVEDLQAATAALGFPSTPQGEGS